MRDFLLHDNKGRRKLHLVKWNALSRKKKMVVWVLNISVSLMKLFCLSGPGDIQSKMIHFGSLLWWRNMVMLKWYGFLSTLNALMGFLYGEQQWSSIKKSFVKFNGLKVRFWEDNCLYDSPIKARFPNLYALSRAKSSLVANLYVINGSNITLEFTYSF